MRSPGGQIGRRAPAGRAFTLVELIVAATVTVLVAGSTVGILRAVVAARQRTDRQTALQQEARAAVETIAVALRNAYRDSRDQPLLEGADAWRGRMPNDRIRFFTVSPLNIRAGRPESDVRECEFRLSRGDPDAPRSRLRDGSTGNALPVLLRRLDPTRNESPDNGGVVEPIARDVVALDMAYHDGDSWCDEWSAKEKGWPLAVRISLAVQARTRPKKIWTTSRIVNFPYRPAPESKDKK